MLDDLPPPEIAKSDLPSNRQVRFTLKLPVRLTPPTKIAKSDLPSNRLYDLLSNRLWRFTPPRNCQVRLTLKSSLAIYSHLSVKCLNI